ncbi:MAG: ABC transporter ATP-binding protein [Planctomycetes bacterium]|nr:ABC transporter ATP-binding protein [Planctomycetota bacterium]
MNNPNDGIVLDHINFSFGRRPILRNCTFSAPVGEVTALIGRNGEGKTTLLRILMGLLTAESGSVRVAGLDPNKSALEIRRRTGYAAPDRLEVPPWMRVAEYLQFLEPFYPNWNRAFALELLHTMRIDFAARVCDLSKGSKSKLAVAAAIAHGPEFLLLDEPFGGLDPVARRNVMEMIISQIAGGSKTVLFVSHSLADVERLADRVAILDRASITWTGTLDEARIQMKESNPIAAGFDLGDLLVTKVAAEKEKVS